MAPTPEQVGRGLAVARLGYGMALLATPALGQRLLGLDPAANATGAYLSRVLANRELFLGLLGVGAAGPAAVDAAYRWGIAVDAGDLAAVALSWRAGRHPTGWFAVLAAASVAACGAGAYASQKS